MGSLFTVAAGDRNNDGYLDIICGGQKSETSVGCIEVFDEPGFDSSITVSGFDETVLATAISARCPDSLPQVFLGTYYRDLYQQQEYPFFGSEHRTGKLHVLNGQDLAVQYVMNRYAFGAVQEVLICDTRGDTCKELLLGKDYYYFQWCLEPVNYACVESWIEVCLSNSFPLLRFYDIGDQGYNPLDEVWFGGLAAGNFNGGLTSLIVGSSHVTNYFASGPQAKLACWDAATAELEWSIEWFWIGNNHVVDLAICNFDSGERNAVCAAYFNGLLEFRRAVSGTILAVSSLPHSLSQLELGNVDHDDLAEICVAFGDSLYVYEAPSITVDVEETDDYYHPEKFCLFQNYPNPFNPKTIIRFTLPVSSEVTLSIYNILGQQIGSFTAYYHADDHAVAWDGRNSSGEEVASGVYFYRLRARQYQDTKKMLLIR